MLEFEEQGYQLRARMVTEPDLPAIDHLCKCAHFDFGLAILQLYFKHCSDEFPWKLVETRNEPQEVVAFFSRNTTVGRTLHMGWQIVVNPAYRNLRITRHIRTDWHLNTTMGNSVQESIFRFPYSILGEKLHGFYGVVRAAQLSQSATDRLQPIDESNIDAVLQLDRDVVNLDRSAFIKEWLATGETYSFACMSGGRCLGFGIARRTSRYFALMPVYARDPATGAALLTALYKCLDMQVTYILVPARCRATQEIVREQLRLSFVGTEHRTVQSPNEEYHTYWNGVDLDCVYGMHDFWPC